METITNIVNTAANAVWGDGTEQVEPASGVQGDVSKGEPFDGGNIDPEHLKKRDSKFTADEEENKEPPSKETQDLEKRTEAVDSKPDASVSITDEPKSASTQGDDKPSAMGDGPKPLATVAKEHGGDAGNLQTGSESASAKGEDANASETKEEDHESKGTGEQYVQTTGLAVDGGDFDATKPGAGREADRLMEEKRVGHDGGADHPTHDSSSSGSTNKDGKPSLKERIKDKLHIHKS